MPPWQIEGDTTMPLGVYRAYGSSIPAPAPDTPDGRSFQSVLRHSPAIDVAAYRASSSARPSLTISRRSRVDQPGVRSFLEVIACVPLSESRSGSEEAFQYHEQRMWHKMAWHNQCQPTPHTVLQKARLVWPRAGKPCMKRDRVGYECRKP
jgi:hypothetical protein